MSWSFVSGGARIGYAMNAPNLPDKTVWVEGPTGGTSQIIIEGTNATTATVGATQWYTLSYAATGGDLDFTTREVGQILENTRYIRPRCVTVTNGMTVTVKILARG
jgi:hypothetical protein